MSNLTSSTEIPTAKTLCNDRKSPLKFKESRIMRTNRFFTLFLLLLLSACSNMLPPEWKLTLTPRSSFAQKVASIFTPTPVASGLSALPSFTASPLFTPAIQITTTPAPATAMPTPHPVNLAEGLTGDPLTPAWSPDGQYIVFALDDPSKPNHAQLYTMAVDGSGWTKLVDHQGANDFLPQWSPDGSQILFCSTAADGSGTNVFVVSADGSALTQLTHDHASQCQAIWSPDGSQIAFISDRQDKTGHLYVMKADGSNLHLAADVNNSAEPVWSPDGSTIVFSGMDRTGIGNGMYSTRPDGFGFIQLIKNPAFEAGMQWSPDGKKIIYQADSTLYMINADSSGQVQVLPKQTGMGGEAWSPDGSWIAFQASPAGDSEIFVVTIDGATLLYFPHPGLEDLSPLFSPDGKKLIFYSHHAHQNDGNLMLITFDNLSFWGK